MTQFRHASFSQTGAGLIEVLITVIVLAVGLLGLAALQGKSIRLNHEAYLRSLATLQANAMADRMRANPVGLSQGLYDAVSGPGTNPNCSTNCTPTQIAAQDIYDWNTANANLLPSGQGSIATSGNIRTITVRWDARRTGATGTACGGNPAVDLTCFELSVRL